MSTEPLQQDDGTENLDEADWTMPFDEWIEQLTPSARDALRKEGARQLDISACRKDHKAGEDLAAPSQILALLTEVRDLLVSQRTIKDFYTTAEVATMLGKAEFTVREWCRHGRVRANKQGSGRGKHQAWVIAHQELQRLQREGLLPVQRQD
jgi:hypothetical protein